MNVIMYSLIIVVVTEVAVTEAIQWCENRVSQLIFLPVKPKMMATRMFAQNDPQSQT